MDLCIFEASLVFKVSSRIAEAVTQRTFSPKTQNSKNKQAKNPEGFSKHLELGILRAMPVESKNVPHKTQAAVLDTL